MLLLAAQAGLQLDPVTGWPALFVSALVVGVSKAGFGAGVGILAIPLMAIAVGSEKMLGLLLPVLILGDLFSVVHYTRSYDGRSLAGLLAGCAPGVACGMVLLGWFRGLGHGARILDGAVGVLCVVFVALQAGLALRRRPSSAALGPGTSGGTRGEGDTPRALSNSSSPAGGEEAKASAGGGASACAPSSGRTALAVAVGLAAGIASTLSHAAGPLVAMFLLPAGFDKRVFVGTTAWFFLGCNLMKLGPFIHSGLVTAEAALCLAYIAPAVVAGTLLGAWLNRKVSPRAFNAIVYALVFATGLRLALGLLGV